MTTTIVSTVTTAGISMASVGDSITVLSMGAIVNPGATIDGTNATGQSVAIDGLVNIYYMWLAGRDTVTITANGSFIGHSSIPIFIGANAALSVLTGGSTINNAGLIQGDLGAIQVFGRDNLIVNSGTISSSQNTVLSANEGHTIIQNSGSITSSLNSAVLMVGTGDSLVNSGRISSADSTVKMSSSFQLLDNSGAIIASEAYGVVAGSTGSLIHNSGTISSGRFAAVRFEDNSLGAVHSVVNDGMITGISGIQSVSADLKVVNHGSIVASSSVAISIDSANFAGVSSITNTGKIWAASMAISGGSEQDFLYNSGTINGDINLGSGDDWLDLRGGFVNGLVTGGAGSDTYLIDDAVVALIEGIGGLAEIDTVRSKVAYQLEANFETLVLLGATNINGMGNTASNTVTGNAGDNRLSGLDGSDTLAGGAGDDTVLGGLSNDTLQGGDGDDVLRGGIGADNLQGGDGDDILIGGGAKDVLNGATGADAFVFLALADTAITQAAADIITDFAQGTDIIDLSRIDAKNATAPNDAFAYIGAAAFGSVAGQLHFVQAGGNTFVEYDVTGDGVADGVIRLNGLFTLTVADFAL